MPEPELKVQAGDPMVLMSDEIGRRMEEQMLYGDGSYGSDRRTPTSTREVERYEEESDFTIEGQRVGVDAGSLALGIAIGVEAARLVESEQQGGAAR